MDMRSEQDPQRTDQFLNADEIILLFTHNLGLRLTDRATDYTEGGYGDAIPLSHCGGAEDIIKFITLSCALLQQDPLLADEAKKSKLEAIYNKYTAYTTNQDPHRSTLTYLPALVLTYAHLLHIGDADKIEPNEKRLPKSEEDLLLHIYTLSDSVLTPDLIFDKTGSYFSDLPVLRLHVLGHFNQQLKTRLTLNYQFFLNQNTMYYVLLSSTHHRFSKSYDLSHYALGKAGRYTFSAADVVGHYSFSPQELTEDILTEHQQTVFLWLKTQLHTLAHPNTLQQSASYLDRCMQFCSNHSISIAALAGVSIFAIYKRLETTQPLDENIPMM